MFAKAPLAGYAKTRLIPRLGAAGAAALHAAFVRRTLAAACAVAGHDLSLWCAPSRHVPFFEACAREYAVTLADQTDGDLGARMHTAFEVLTRNGHPVVLVGTDCPELGADHLLAAHAALNAGDDAVFIPTEDGGYALIGLQRAHPRLFDRMPWSTAEVMRETRMRVRELGWRWSELPALWDVDAPADYDRLLRRARTDPLIAADLPPDATPAERPGAA